MTVTSPPEHIHFKGASALWRLYRARSSSRMAVTISFENPQDPGCSLLTKHESILPIKRKPSRTLLYIRNRANTANITMVAMGVVLAALSFHRLLSLYMTHRRWINAPITYLQRTCPAPSYPTLLPTQTAGKICITTLTDAKSTSRLQRFLRWRNFDGILELTWQNKAEYAKKHGYHLYDGSDLIDTSRPPAWSKIQAVQHLIHNEACDWVMWVDADTVIMNSETRIEDFLPFDSKDLLVGSDNGGGYNSGVFIIRNTEWSRQFLQDWWNMRSFVRPPGMSLSGDNSAMKALLADMDDFEQHVLSPARCTFNSFAQFLTLSQSISVMDSLDEQEWYLDERYYHKGDFIAHTPGYDNKAECLRLLLNEAR